jgi:hypothetical protein
MNQVQKTWIVLAAVVLGLALVACSCGALSPLLANTPTPIIRPAPTEPPPTLAPAPTAAPPLSTGYDPLPWNDDFRNPASGWDVYDNAEDSAGYKDGVYYVISRTAEYTSYGAANKNFKDTLIEVDATPVDSPADNSFSYGIGCRTQSNDDGYTFEIKADGYFAVGYYSGGGESYQSLLDGDEWQESTALFPGRITNHFAVFCSGEDLKLAINGKLVWEGRDATFQDGDISLSTGTYADDNTPAEVHFDNLKVSQPGETIPALDLP